ncbi:MAG: GlsB/YeaQ/YmgE family stress response membrane protein [Actinomycetota bacterium]
MGLISWIAIGLIAGLLARLIMPPTGPGGLLVAAILGVAGASIGGFLAGILGGTGTTGFNAWSLPAAILGAVALLFSYELVIRRTS